jgi:hypothetical protein
MLPSSLPTKCIFTFQCFACDVNIYEKNEFRWGCGSRGRASNSKLTALSSNPNASKKGEN